MVKMLFLHSIRKPAHNLHHHQHPWHSGYTSQEDAIFVNAIILCWVQFCIHALRISIIHFICYLLLLDISLTKVKEYWENNIPSCPWMMPFMYYLIYLRVYTIALTEMFPCNGGWHWNKRTLFLFSAVVNWCI